LRWRGAGNCSNFREKIAGIRNEDSVAGIRPILGLFEGCCTGAADGYGRMTGKPAMTLLHLGPGLGNGIANLHNARRARTPVLNVIGDHATWHRSVDAPLSMDIVALAETVSGWQRTSTIPQNLSNDTADAITAALSGKVATLIVPSDVQWSDSPDDQIKPPKTLDASADNESIERAADLLRTDQKAALILGGWALRKRGLAAAARIKVKTGCDHLSETGSGPHGTGCEYSGDGIHSLFSQTGTGPVIQIPSSRAGGRR
jgi:acetolactate synthase-1/2/3 large subunit